MGGGSPPASSSSSAPLPLSQPLSQRSQAQAASESVDPLELARLRALVRYEFTTPPTTDELVDALGAAHNSVHAAYHVVRARRQQQQQQQQQEEQQQQVTAAAAAAAMATPSNKRRADETDHDAPSKRAREDASPPPPIVRSLRLSSSQDAEMASPASSQTVVGGGVGYLASLGSQQQQRKSPRTADDEVRIAYLQRNLSQELESSQEASEEQPHVTSEREMVVDVVLVPMADLAKARRLLDDAVHARRSDCAAPTDVKWTESFLDAFGAASSAALAQHLESVCDAMAAWLLEIDDHDAGSRKGKALELVVDIAAKLPRSDGAGELSQHAARVETSGDDSEAAALQHELEHPNAQTSALTRSKAADRAIARLTGECETNLDRVSWFADANSANQTHQREIREVIKMLHDRLAEIMENCGAEVRAGDSAVADARVAKETRSAQIREFARKRCEELLAREETDASAEVEAWKAIWSLEDVEIAALVESCEQSEAKIRASKTSMKKTRLELVFVERAAQLFAAVRELREASLRRAMQAFEDSRVACDQRATDALVRCVPVLTLALHKYYEFHSARQARAKAEVDEQQRALDTHIEYFGDSAPTTRDDLNKRIREFVGLISRSMQTILQVADAQSRLWETRKATLPRAVRQVVVREYGKLWRQLSGPVQDVMQKFVDRMRLETESEKETPAASSAAAATPPRAPAPALLASATASAVRVPSTHVSPIRVVDLAMTQEVASFLRQAEPVSSMFAIASAVDAAPSIVASPPKAPLLMPPVPPAPQIPVVGASAVRAAADAETHKFQVGATLFTKFGEGKDEHFVRGRVERLLADGLYSVAYDNGDVFDVHPSYLHSEAQVERDLELRERRTEGASSSSSGGGEDGSCAVM